MNQPTPLEIIGLFTVIAALVAALIGLVLLVCSIIRWRHECRETAGRARAIESSVASVGRSLDFAVKRMEDRRP